MASTTTTTTTSSSSLRFYRQEAIPPLLSTPPNTFQILLLYLKHLHHLSGRISTTTSSLPLGPILTLLHHPSARISSKTVSLPPTPIPKRPPPIPTLQQMKRRKQADRKVPKISPRMPHRPSQRREAALRGQKTKDLGTDTTSGLTRRRKSRIPGFSDIGKVED